MRIEFIRAINIINEAYVKATIERSTCISARCSLNADNGELISAEIDNLLDREAKLQKIMNALYEARIEMKEYLEGHYK